jgi:hypothetical protein
MRSVHALVALTAVVLGAAALVAPAPASAVCSVFDRHPCAPTVCSVFRRGPCLPDYEYPIGQDLRVTIESNSSDKGSVGQAPEQDRADADHAVNTILGLFAALRSCWVPPTADEARPGMQMSVRLSFKRSGEIIGKPRLTYASPEASREERDVYRHAIDAALDRCTPMPFTKGLGGAIAGRPIAIRFVDNRERAQ